MSSRERYILIVRHGTKNKLSNNYDLPICSKNYCQDKNTFSKLNTIKKSPNKKVVYSSPFLRTKQTAGRMAKKLNYSQPIYIDEGLGEAYTQVTQQLKKCGENVGYRVPKSSPTRIDKCMKNISNKEQLILKNAQHELSKYKYKISNRLKKSPKSKKQQDNLFKRSVTKILKENPTKDIIIVTHGRNVRKSLQIIAPRRLIPRIGLLPSTCGSVLYKQSGTKTSINDSKGIFMI